MKNLLFTLCTLLALTATAQRPGTQPMFEPVKYLDDTYHMRNVGIGTLSPAVNFHVVGNIRLVPTTDTLAAGKVLTSDASGNAHWRTPSGGSGDYSPWDTTATDIIQKDTTLSVGIGTTIPSSTLQVIGTFDQQYNYDDTRQTISNSAGMFPGPIIFNKEVVTGYSTYTYWANNSITSNATDSVAGTSTNMALTATGLGIGNTSPTAKLDVTGGISGYTTKLSESFYFVWAGNDTLSQVVVDKNSAHFDLQRTGYSLIFNASLATGDINIQSGGDDHTGDITMNAHDALALVGIGTSTPTSKLHVVGDLKLTGTIKGTALPAFDDDADAASLSAGDFYQTTGSGAAPLNVAGIVMVKQ